MPRAHINTTTKLASTLLARGEIPYEHAKLISAAQLISLYQFDHGILHAIDPNNEYWNLTPRLIAPHREKSRRDTSIVAKVRRLTAEQETFRRRVLEKPAGAHRVLSSKWPKGRKLQSRGFKR